MAADEVVRWSSVVGEYGVLLTEMGSMEKLSTPIKSYPRIKYTCMTASKKYIAMGSNTGGLYIFDRQTLKHPRFISNKDGPVHAVCFAQRRSLLAVATSLGVVLVWEVSSRHREKPKLIRRSEEHKNTTVSALCWDDEEGRLFAGGMKGVVSVVHVPPSSKLPHSVNKGLSMLHTSGIVAKAHTAIVQLDCVGEKLLVSTMTKSAIVDLKSLDSVPVGVKLRDGLYGSCFFKENMSESPAIYSARPGSRLWEASIDGQVMSTQQYKKLLATPPVNILGCGLSAAEPTAEGDFPPQSVNFAKLLLVRKRFLVTWHGTSLYIIDPILGQLVAWYSLDSGVLDICCVGNELYVYDTEGFVKWFGLLSVKECVAKLYEMGEIKQCLMLLLDCKQYIIPGSARDLVPISLVSNLREGLCEENNEGNQDVILGLEELERDMEPAAVVSDHPPNYHGNLSMTDSPDTLSVCSDTFTDELEITISSPGIGEMGDNNDDDGLLSKGRKLKKQWSGDISFEGMLMSAAAAAKKFTAERQMGIGKLIRSQSADNAGNVKSVQTKDGIESFADQHHENVQGRVNSDTDGGQYNEGIDIQETIQEEESPLLGKKILEQSPCHSDDSESRQSGNEGVAAEEEAAEKKEKLSFKEKRRRKKRVVTVDIDTPQIKQEFYLDSPTPHGRSSSFRRTYSSTEDTEVRSRRLSEPASPVQSELPPAIPAMLSKAKGLLKKKLKVPSEDQSPSPSLSPTPPAEEGATDDIEEENMKCPPEVEKLIQCSARTRNEVKNPIILFSIRSLCQAFEVWIPKLHEAMKSCVELDVSSRNGNIDLKSFLDGYAFDDVSYLAQMCFDCGIYGLEGLESLEGVYNLKTISKASSNGCMVVQDKKEISNVDISRDDNPDKIVSNTSETVVERQFTEHIPTSHEGVEGIDESSQNHLSSADSDVSSPNADASTSLFTSSTFTEEGNFNVKASNAYSRESTMEISSDDVNSDCIEALKASPCEANGTKQNFTDNAVFSHEDVSRNSSLGQKMISSLQSVQSCEQMCWQCENKTAFCRNYSGRVSDKGPAQKEDDISRSRFLSFYFFLLDVKRLRRTLLMSKGDRQKTWRTFIDCLSGLVSTDDVIARYINEGDARRALHELHDGMDVYADSLLCHLTCLYEHDSHETMLTCARMFPDIQPWEVMEICRQSKSLSLESTSDDFVFYAEQLIRWRAEVGNTKEQTVSKICEDMGVAKWWFHCSLIAGSPKERLHCEHCGKPRPGSHILPRQNAEHLQQLIDYLCQKDPKELIDFMDFCWKHGYWSGLIRLCVTTNLRREALDLVVSLSDLQLIKDPQSWGPLPKSLDEWRHLLELILARDYHGGEPRDSPHVCPPLAASGWLADLTWSNVISLMLERLGAGHTVNLLQALPLDTPLLTTEFYYSCLMGAVIERRQRTLIHELLKKLDSYLWSQRSGALAPKLNNFRKEEEICGPKTKEDIKPQLDSLWQFRTLEDGASNWGQNIRLSDGECLVCSLKLCEQISTSNQGLLMFECGHVFHKHCVPEAACVLCFHQNLTSVGASIL